MITPNDELIAALKDCRKRVANMASEGRPPSMSIPARPTIDDDIVICDTLDRAIAALSSQDAAIQQEPVMAYLKEWFDIDGSPRCRVDLSIFNEPWLEHLIPKVTPLYAHPQSATQPSEHATDAYVLTTGEESVLNKTLMRSVVQPQPATDKAEPVLPCDFIVGGGRFHKGVEVRLAQGAVGHLYARMRELEPPQTEEQIAARKALEEMGCTAFSKDMRTTENYRARANDMRRNAAADTDPDSASYLRNIAFMLDKAAELSCIAADRALRADSWISCDERLPETSCRAGRDGDCTWKHCPQLRDGEPAKSKRSCPMPKCDGEQP